MSKSAVFLLFSSVVISAISCAVVKRENQNLEILRDDLAQVGGALENFTFDIIESIVNKFEEKKKSNETVEDAETSTVTQPIRAKRSASMDDDVATLCRKHLKCELNQNQIEDLRIQVQKLQELINLIKDQQNILRVLNVTEVEVNKRENIKNITATGNVSNNNEEELEYIHENLREAIKSLNETREMLEVQKERDRVLEVSVRKQRKEIESLKSVVRLILAGNSSAAAQNDILGAKFSNSSAEKARASGDFSEIKKFLRKLPKEDRDEEEVINEDDSREIQKKILEIEKKLQRKKKQGSLTKQLKALERQLNSEEEVDENGAFLKQLQKALNREENRGGDVNDLDDLKDAIDRLRPKEDDSLQFQAILSKLIRNQKNNRRPAQVQNFPKKIEPAGQVQYYCPGGAAPALSPSPPPGGYYRGPVRNVQYNARPENGFFPDAPANYYPEGSPNGASPEKSINYQPEIGDNQQKYQEDLRSEIDGLQTAIDGLNRPEYVQKPEDKAMIDDLERQINDLRGIVNNLNNYSGPRAKREVNNNEIDDPDAVIDKMTNYIGNFFKEPEKNDKVQEIQDKIHNLKNELGKSNELVRAAGGNYNYYDDEQYYQPMPKSVKKNSAKTDLFLQIVSKILDKVIASIPLVIKKLFNFGFDELTQINYHDYEIQTILKNLGVFGYLPIVILKLIRGTSSFLMILKKNSFFKNFLLPLIILGLIASSVFFLIWLLQPDYENQYKAIDYNEPNNIIYKTPSYPNSAQDNYYDRKSNYLIK